MESEATAVDPAQSGLRRSRDHVGKMPGWADGERLEARPSAVETQRRLDISALSTLNKRADLAKVFKVGASAPFLG